MPDLVRLPSELASPCWGQHNRAYAAIPFVMWDAQGGILSFDVSHQLLDVGLRRCVHHIVGQEVQRGAEEHMAWGKDFLYIPNKSKPLYDSVCI